MRTREERGAAAAFVVFLAVALLAVAGLVIDGGYALGARREAMNHAEQAARAGADALQAGSLRSGDFTAGPTARAAAQAYLAGVGTTGTVAVTGEEVTVTVHTHYRPRLMSAVGVGSLPVSSTATATLVDGERPR